MKFDRSNHSDESLLKLYDAILLPRMIEEKMLILLRQGRISKWFSGIGQEGISVGMTQAIRTGDYILPLHRNLGVFTGREMPLDRLFRQWQGKADGYTNGRDRSFHFGAPGHRVIGMISHLGAMLGVADGIALASNLDKEETIAVVFSGDGGASEGDFHEAINVAAVWELPVIFLIENNGYGLSTPSRDQFRFKQFIDKAIGYGMSGQRVDGNDFAAVFSVLSEAVARARAGSGPSLIEAHTYRMQAHTNADDDTRYREREEVQSWICRDPLTRLQSHLREAGVLDDEAEERFAAEAELVAAELREAMNREVSVHPSELFEHVFAQRPATLEQQWELLQDEIVRTEASA